MKFPYGLSDFETLISENYLYIDRSDRISLLEETGRTLLFLRPRRFGKSLLLSMLENYYDIAKADKFEQLFGHLAIGQQPTAKQNQYLILKWNFSLIDPQGSVEEIKGSLHDHLNSGIIAFAHKYQQLLAHEVELKADNALFSFQSALSAVRTTPHKIYLLIDEYDNFANEVMMAARSPDPQKRYETLIQGEGMLKTVFKAIKAGTEGWGVDRIFMTGVSPVVMSDLTSGFNLAKSIYLAPQFNNLCGFEETEIETVLQQIVRACAFDPDEANRALEMMRVFYNGYSFAESCPPLIYNPTLAMYFFDHFKDNCQYPRQMLDENLAMDRSKIEYVSRLPHGEQVISKVTNNQDPLTLDGLAHRFGVQDVLYGVKDTTFIVSLLYYFGVLTLTDQHTVLGELILKIPNLVIRKLYVERIQELLLNNFQSKQEAQQVVHQFYQDGDLERVCDFIEQTYFKIFDNRDYRWTNELTIKTVFMTLLFNDVFYIMDSEMALERSYADMTMIVRPDMRQFALLDFLIEFKYLSLKDAGLSGEAAREMSREELKEMAIVKEKMSQAKEKLAGYQQKLAAHYGEQLRLQIYSVVAVGYERIVWEQV